jgi:cyclopropane-fatty-acyl-phospholipid synthase
VFLTASSNGKAVPRVLADLAAQAGIRFNGDRPWDIQVHDPAMFRRVLAQGSLGLGESYMDGLWDAAQLDETFNRLLRADLDRRVWRVVPLRLLGHVLRERLFNLQSVRRAFEVGKRHYDIGNSLFEAMLDPTMSYSCGFWQDARTLEQAQIAKLDLICRKLELEPWQRVLDIGCGWGGLAAYAARNYRVEVVGVTVSHEQQVLAQQRCAGLPVRIELADYRDLEGRYDRVVSVGMFEHVGPKNYRRYFETVARVMNDQGLFLLHTIGSMTPSTTSDPWTDKYIFPSGRIPGAKELLGALDKHFIVEDWHNFGPDYDRTLMAWWANLDAAWSALCGDRYDERFYRMWKYYLHSCAGYFRSRHGQLWQIVLAKRARQQTYRSIRCRSCHGSRADQRSDRPRLVRDVRGSERPRANAVGAKVVYLAPERRAGIDAEDAPSSPP